MARTHRLSTTAALIVCLAGAPLSSTLFASDEELSSSEASSSQPVSGLFSSPPSTAGRSPFTFTDARLSEIEPAGPANAHAWRSTFDFTPIESSAYAQRRGYRGRGGGGGRSTAIAAIALGAAASIAGTAILVYANRPECGTNQTASGCGYGTKVVGGAVLSAGLVGIFVGALTWR
jgi:hypothetical protein